MTLERAAAPTLGIRVYGFACCALGVIGLVWHDFATVWQPVQALGDVPFREAFAIVVALALVLGGIAVQLQRTARAGVIVLGVANCIFALFWLPRVIGFPRIFGTWGGFLEEFAPVAASVTAYALVSPRDWSRREQVGQIGRVLFGICVVSFGVSHFTAIGQTADLVPKWMPFGGPFWAWVTGVAHVLAGLAILSGVLAKTATRLLTVMLGVFGALVWLPSLFAYPTNHTVWAGNAVNLVILGAAWIVADWFT